MKVVSTRVSNEVFDALQQHCNQNSQNLSQGLASALHVFLQNNKDKELSAKKDAEDPAKVSEESDKPGEEEGMKDLSTFEALLEESNQKMADTFSKSIEGLSNVLKEKFDPNKLPGGDKMDQDTKDYLDKIGKSLEKHGKMLEGLFGERKEKENQNRIKQLVTDALGPVVKEVKLIKGMVCDDQGNCRLPTKEELDNLRTEQDRKLEKIKEEAKKIPEAKPDLSQFSNKELYSQLIKSETAVGDLKKVHIEKALEDPAYRKEFLDALCDNEECRVDVMKKVEEFSGQKEETEKKEKTKEGKSFLLSKKEG